MQMDQLSWTNQQMINPAWSVCLCSSLFFHPCRKRILQLGARKINKTINPRLANASTLDIYSHSQSQHANTPPLSSLLLSSPLRSSPLHLEIQPSKTSRPSLSSSVQTWVDPFCTPWRTRTQIPPSGTAWETNPSHQNLPLPHHHVPKSPHGLVTSDLTQNCFQAWMNLKQSPTRTPTPRALLSVSPSSVFLSVWLLFALSGCTETPTINSQTPKTIQDREMNQRLTPLSLTSETQGSILNGNIGACC